MSNDEKKIVNDITPKALQRIERAEVAHGLRPPRLEFGSPPPEEPDPGAVLYLADAGTRLNADGTPAATPNDPSSHVQIFDGARAEELVTAGVDHSEAVRRAAAEFGIQKTKTKTRKTKGTKK